MSKSNASLSFYVHIPYCIKRCGYCDFNTYTPAELQDGATLEIVSGDYIDAVLKELAAAPLDEVPTIFFGGGTPSLLPPKDLGRLLPQLKSVMASPKIVRLPLRQIQIQ